jgi:hypothetical protein
MPKIFNASATFRKLRPAAGRLGKGNSGNIGMTFALALPVVIAFAGAALDYGRANLDKSSIQDTLDAAVLAGVAGPGAEELSGSVGPATAVQKIRIAKDYFTANLPGTVNIESTSFYFDDDVLIGNVAGKLDTQLLHFVGLDNIDLSLTSAATRKASRVELCFMAMHETRKHTLEMKGTVSVIAPDCNIYGNSSHHDDVVDPHSELNFLIGKTVSAVGYGHHYLENVSPPLTHGIERIADPMLSLVIPTVSEDDCDFEELEIEDENMTLSPGVYCEGLSVVESEVKLEPGIYYITEGEFELEDAVLTGDGVTFVLVDDDVELDWVSSEIRITGPTSGTYAGIVMMGTRQSTNHTFEESTVDLTGVVYLPNGKLTWENDGTPAINGDWTAWIIDGVTWTGNGKIYINFDKADSDVPYPSGLSVIPVEGQPRLVL